MVPTHRTIKYFCQKLQIFWSEHHNSFNTKQWNSWYNISWTSNPYIPTMKYSFKNPSWWFEKFGMPVLCNVWCDIISYELSAPQKYSSTHFSAVRAGQRPGRCVRRWNLISHYTQHKRNIKTIFCPGWAELCWAGLARLGENSEMGLVSEWFSALTQECESLTWNNRLILPSHVDEIIYY